MTVKQLIKQLAKLDPETSVYLSSDEEGNSFGNLHEIDEAENGVVLYPTGHLEFDDLYND